MVRMAFQDNDLKVAESKTPTGSKTGYPRFLLGLAEGAEAHVRHRGEVLNAVGLDAERANPDLLCGLIRTTLFAEICGHRSRPRCSPRAGVE
jgi:hypothetical protein